MLITRDHVQAQLDSLQLLQSCFPLEGELTVLSPTAALQAYATHVDLPSSSAHLLPDIQCLLTLSIHSCPVVLAIRLPTHSVLSGETARATVTVQQPGWLARGEHTKLELVLAQAEEGDILELIDLARASLEDLHTAYVAAGETVEPIEETNQEEVRVWFWFQSLSTRAKRDEMVAWAPEYGLTGWCLAGKPGLLCVEGRAKKVDEYMAEIKGRSWADVPSFQKKVSERFRETIIPPPSIPNTSSSPFAGPNTTPLAPPPPPGTGRLFTTMQEITNLIDQGGARGNRGDMGMIRDWMDSHGVGERFAIVLGMKER